ncbi:Probable multidrug resistance-associated protein lethal(2)03659 [Eumeta japonica]|uniref:Probable multidrug resistance-associated protein lethal(2)03659 n=1 Tax=Eumeta variegata TaxID=151549 RepID=A0A4C1SYU2_EUMVA|nr:Probable multidrug resistance-associated protein lethal(2)03659 [Eumeta japonica]
MNRFSKDMGAVDELLPKAFLDAAQQLLVMAGAVILASTVNPMFLAVVAVLACIFYFLRKVYLKSSKNIKRFEGITRSPVFTHLGATLAGLPTIRASQAQNVIQDEFDKLLASLRLCRPNLSRLK